MSVFFSSLRFAGSSGGGTNVIGRFGDFAINRLFTNTFSCVSVRFSPRLELDVVAVSGSGSVSPSLSWSSSSGLSVFLRPHHHSRSLLRYDSHVHALLVPLWDLLHHLLSSTSASVRSRWLPWGSLLTSCSLRVVVHSAHTQLHCLFGQGVRPWGRSFPATRRISICLPTLVLDFQIPFRLLEDVFSSIWHIVFGRASSPSPLWPSTMSVQGLEGGRGAGMTGAQGGEERSTLANFGVDPKVGVKVFRFQVSGSRSQVQHDCTWRWDSGKGFFAPDAGAKRDGAR